MRKRVEAEVVMLPQKDGVIISDVGAYDTDIVAATKEAVKDLNEARPLNHLYVTIKIKKLDDIKEGDYFTVRANSNAPFYDKLFKCTGTNVRNYGLVETEGNSFGKNLCQKVVASTDSTLTECDGCKRSKGKLGSVYTCSCGLKEIASIRPKFVQAYIKAQGKIKKIMIEFETIAKIKEDSTMIYKGLELPILGLYMTYEDGLGVYPDGTRVFDLCLKGTTFVKSHGYEFAVIEETRFEWMKERVKTRDDGSIVIHKSRTFSEQDMIDFAEFAKGARHIDLKYEEWLELKNK